MEEIKIGSVVRVGRIEGPNMIVTFVNEQQVVVFWFDDHNGYQTAVFNPSLVELV